MPINALTRRCSLRPAGCPIQREADVPSLGRQVRPPQSVTRSVRLVVGCLWMTCIAGLVFGVRSAEAIEMFTFFGDGSRIGLPSLEVPIEAYPGIPLRSDRIRMRTGRFARGWRGNGGRGTTMRQPVELGQGEKDVGGGITIRPMAPKQASSAPQRIPQQVRAIGKNGPSTTPPTAPLPPE